MSDYSDLSARAPLPEFLHGTLLIHALIVKLLVTAM
jgi:hypothetical protein